MSIDEILHGLAESPADPADLDGAIQAFRAACKRVDELPRGRQRIRDIAELLDAEDEAYAAATTTLSREDGNIFELLSPAADRGNGLAAWLIADLMDGHGLIHDALFWYQRAADNGETRACARLKNLSASQARMTSGSRSTAAASNMARQSPWTDPRLISGMFFEDIVSELNMPTETGRKVVRFTLWPTVERAREKERAERRQRFGQTSQIRSAGSAGGAA